MYAVSFAWRQLCLSQMGFATLVIAYVPGRHVGQDLPRSQPMAKLPEAGTAGATIPGPRDTVGGVIDALWEVNAQRGQPAGSLLPVAALPLVSAIKVGSALIPSPSKCLRSQDAS